MELGLAGKVALVTGSSSGIGRSVALTLANEGVSVVVTGRDKARIDAVSGEIKACGVKVLGLTIDLAQDSDVRRMIEAATDRFGRIDILVNNAGFGRISDPMCFPDEEFRFEMEVMFYSVVRASMLAVPHMRRGGWGRIINISSVWGKQPGGLFDYDAIKAAVNMFTKDLANYLAKDNIMVNAVCPGPTRTPLWERPGGSGDQMGKVLGMSGREAMDWVAKTQIPVGHFGEPEDVANLVVFLASDRAKYVTGQAINVDGGLIKAIV
jgi:3-oxoacyl-[acyl-carrier protein] reductase